MPLCIGCICRGGSIDSVAERLGMDPDKAAVLAAELGEQGIVDSGARRAVER